MFDGPRLKPPVIKDFSVRVSSESINKKRPETHINDGPLLHHDGIIGGVRRLLGRALEDEHAVHGRDAVVWEGRGKSKQGVKYTVPELLTIDPSLPFGLELLTPRMTEQ